MENIKYNEIKLNEVTVRGYDVHRRYGTDWVTEYTYVTTESLTVEQFDKVLAEIGGIYGEISYIKRLLTFGNGKKLYKHICKAVMY